MNAPELPATVRDLHDDILRIACLEIEWLNIVGQQAEVPALLDAVERIIAGAGGGGAAEA